MQNVSRPHDNAVTKHKTKAIKVNFFTADSLIVAAV